MKIDILSKAHIQNEICILKFKLSNTDYKVIKHYEGFITDKEYEPIKKQRQEWRNKINSLEEQLKQNNYGKE